MDGTAGWFVGYTNDDDGIHVWAPGQGKKCILGYEPSVLEILEAIGASDEAERRIKAALAAMDRGMYGDPEVPFRMRAALEGRNYE